MKNKKQKFYGLILIIMGLLVTIIVKDCTVAFILIPIGICTITTKENIII